MNRQADCEATKNKTQQNPEVTLKSHHRNHLFLWKKSYRARPNQISLLVRWQQVVSHHALLVPVYVTASILFWLLQILCFLVSSLLVTHHAAFWGPEAKLQPAGHITPRRLIKGLTVTSTQTPKSLQQVLLLNTNFICFKWCKKQKWKSRNVIPLSQLLFFLLAVNKIDKLDKLKWESRQSPLLRCKVC